MSLSENIFIVHWKTYLFPVYYNGGAQLLRSDNNHNTQCSYVNWMIYLISTGHLSSIITMVSYEHVSLWKSDVKLALPPNQ